ncbi:hypothetical protein C475_03229 [Halosimplex carlsbadense 2-9-1]|uniref:DUF7305 domain-containing protein n=1 Tax=Halosimplex carlsbadense 2-9-1 TaxID=797114 RepID=M0D109_9EURY|nr:hypothetical protein C475_03229 [Halosimplex carlsbadense 2-9-1]
MVLLAGLVLAGATVVVVAGSTAINEAQDGTSYSTAEQSMQSLDAEIQETLANDGGQSFDLPPIENGNWKRVDDGAVTLTLEGSGGSSDSVSTDLGAIVYEQGERTLAYQNGAIFERTGEGTAVTSEPQIGYRTRNDEPTLNIPVVQLLGTGNGVDGRVRFEQQPATDLLESIDRSKFASIGAGEPINPIRPGMEVTLTIESQYYEGWGAVLESRLSAPISYDHTNEQVSFTLQGPSPATSVSTSITAVGGVLPVTNTISTDSYDSANGPYSAPGGSNGDVWTRGSLDPSSAVTIRGDVRAEEGVEQITNTLEVYGTTALGDNPSGTTVFAGGSPVFRDTFSTKDTFETAGSSVTFQGDVIVDNDVVLFDGSVIEDPGPDEADMYVDGDAEIGSGAVIEGDLYVRGDLEFSDNTGGGAKPYVKGDVITTDQNIEGNPSEVVVDGTVQQPSTIPSSSMEDPLETDVPADLTERNPSEVNSDFQTFSNPGDRDNTAATYISGNELICGGLSQCYKNAGPNPQLWSNDDTNTIRLEAGDYYLNAIDLGNTNLELDTSNGPIRIFVRDYVSVIGSSTISVPSAENDVEIYVDGQSTSSGGHAFYMTGSSKFTTTGDQASLMSVYVNPSKSMELNSDASFTGLLHGGSSSGADTKVTNDVDMYGSMIGDVTEVSSNFEIHYDEALSSRSYVTSVSGSDRILYLQMKNRAVSVDG